MLDKSFDEHAYIKVGRLCSEEPKIWFEERSNYLYIEIGRATLALPRDFIKKHRKSFESLMDILGTTLQDIDITKEEKKIKNWDLKSDF